MVRHGKLSRGCQICRKRRIKCDQGMPACGQCQKAGWTCPQYGDTVDRMFQPQIVKGSGQSITKANSRTSKIKPIQRTSQTPLLPPSISSTIDDTAIEYFLANHAFRERNVARGHFEYLFEYTPIMNTNNTLLWSLSAAALSSYAHRFQYPILLRRARIYYGHALNSLQVELSSPTETTSSRIIISMTLLGYFETITGESLKSLIRTGVHMRGAMKTISMQASTLLKSRHGMQLFTQMSWCRLQTCILRSIPIPEELRRTRQYAASLVDTNDPAWKVSEVMEKVAQFRADIKQQVLHNSLSIVDAALGLDQELSVLADTMPIKWKFQCFPAPENSEFVFGPLYHVYPDLWMACIWNFLRSCRLVLHKEMRPRLMEGIYSTELAVSSEYIYYYQQSTAVVETLATAICATLPQFCHRLPMTSHANMHKEPNLPKTHIHGHTVENGEPATACVYLFWPLLNAGETTQSDSQRDWIINRCRYIGRMTGIQQSFALADLLESGEDIDSWFDRQGGEVLLS